MIVLIVREGGVRGKGTRGSCTCFIDQSETECLDGECCITTSELSLTPDSSRDTTINAGPTRLATSVEGDRHPTIKPRAELAVLPYWGWRRGDGRVGSRAKQGTVFPR